MAKITGEVTITLPLAQAFAIEEALNHTLARPATEWQERTVRETVKGETLEALRMDLSKALRP